MPHPCPHHCPKPAPGNGLAAAAAAVICVIVIARAAARPIEHAAGLLVDAILIAAASILGLAAIGGIAYVALRARASHVTDRQAITEHAPTTLRVVQGRSEPRAIEPPRARRTPDGMSDAARSDLRRGHRI
jgi:hypothetical protein